MTKNPAAIALLEALTPTDPMEHITDTPPPEHSLEAIKSAGGPSISECLRVLQKAIDEYNSHERNAFACGLRVGMAAATAKEMMPHGEFLGWVKANITTMSVQWVRRCMQAAEVMAYLDGHPQREEVLAEYKGIERVSSLLPQFEAAKQAGAATPVIAPPPPKAPKLKIDRTPAPADTDDDPLLDGTLQRSLDLDLRAGKLTEWESRLEARERELDERERNVAMREARLTADTPTDVAVKDDGGLEATRQKARKAEQAKKDGLSRPRAATQKPRKDKAKGVVASTPKNGSETGSNHDDTPM